ncbi:MAG: hypothetical protein ACYTG1_03080 [Planctomycetota bacterium]|jgi:hypothetical protein
MARKNQHTFAKRQRELKKAEKLAEKKARRAERKDPGFHAADDVVEDVGAEEAPPEQVDEKTAPQ